MAIPVDRDGTLMRAAKEAVMPHFLASPPETQQTFTTLTDTSEVLTLAAGEDAMTAEGEPSRKPRRLVRLRADYDPLLELDRRAIPSFGSSMRTPDLRFSRPEGSFGARAVGNAIHAFLERVAKEVAIKIQAGSDLDQSADLLLKEVPGWAPAIRSMLRAGALPPDAVDRAAGTVERALRNLLSSADGRWLMLPHREAATESAWRSMSTENTTRVRLDRTFFAGSKPRTKENGTLWIVDFKTGDRAESDREAYLADERNRYEGQLRTYAEARLRSLPHDTPVMLALFYPLMGELVYWPYGDGKEVVHSPDVARSNTIRREKTQMSLFS